MSDTASRDANNVPTIQGVSSIDLKTPVNIAVNPTTGALLIDASTIASAPDQGRIWSCGFELDTLTSGKEIDSIDDATNSLSLSTSVVRSGKYSFHCNTTSSNAFSTATYSFGDTTGITYYRFYIYVAQSNVVGNNGSIFEVRDSNNNILAYFVINNDPAIGFFSGLGVSKFTGLTLNKWLRIELKIDATNLASVNFTMSIDGVSLSPITGEDLQTAGFGYPNNVLFGLDDDDSVDIYFDDIAINTADWVGESNLLVVRPNGFGDVTQFTPTGLGDNYLNVDEITPNDATDYNSSKTLNQIDEYTLSSTGLSIQDTINLVHVGARYRGAGASSNASFVSRIKKISGGTVSESTAITPAGTTWETNSNASPHTYPLTLYNDPDGARWTSASLDNTQIGARISTGNTNNVDLSTMWMYVDYTPATPDNEVYSPAAKVVAPVGYPHKADYYTDGVADDVQIQAAITALSPNGGSVYVVKGTYAISATVTAPSNVMTFGDASATIFNYAGGTSFVGLLKDVNGSNIQGQLVLKNQPLTSGTGILIRSDTTYDVTVPDSTTLSLLYIGHHNESATGGLFQGIKVITDSELVDTAAGISVTNVGKSDGIYISMAGKSGLTASTPTGLGIDMNRGSSIGTENSSVNTGNGIQVWDWSVTDTNSSNPTGIYLKKLNNLNTRHDLIKLIANQYAIEMITPAGTGYDGTKPILTLTSKFNLLASGSLASVGYGMFGVNSLVMSGTPPNGSVGVINDSNTTAAYLTTVSGSAELIVRKNDFSSTGRGFILATQASQNESLRVTSTGLLGLGTNNPTYKADIYGSTRILGGLYIDKLTTPSTPVITPKGTITATTLNTGGTGYVVNDILLLSGGTGGQVTVNSVDGSGVILTYTLSAAGGGYVVATASTTLSRGSGATFNTTVTSEGALATVTLNAGGSNYLVNDTLSVVSATGGSGGVITVNSVSGGAIVTYTLTTPGLNYTAVTGATTTLTSGGTGARINITSIATGATTYAYKITALSATGETVASSAGTSTTSNATLDANNFNSISWTSGLSGAIVEKYNVYRTTAGGTPSTTGLIGVVTSPTATLIDTGLSASGSVPTTDTSGNVGIGTTTPTASLHLRAGSATASTAPIKLTSGTNLTTPEAGTIEFDGTSLYFSDNAGTPARHTIVTLDQVQTLTNKTLTAPAITSPTGIVQADITGLTTASSPTFAGLSLGTGALSTVGNISIDGSAARSITVAAAASGAGQALTITSGDAQSGATDTAGGNAVIQTGRGTGTGTAQFQVLVNKPASGTGTGYGTLVNALTIAVSSGSTYSYAPAAASGTAGVVNIKGQDAGASSNAGGGELRLQAGQTRGQAAIGAVTLFTSPLNVTSGTGQNVAIERAGFGHSKVLTNASPINLINFTNASNTVIGGIIRYAVEVFDGTNLQMETGEITVQCANKGGTFSGNTVTQIGSAKQFLGSGTLAMTWAITGANPAVLSLNANSSLTPSSQYPRITYSVDNLTQQAIAIQ